MVALCKSSTRELWLSQRVHESLTYPLRKMTLLIEIQDHDFSLGERAGQHFITPLLAVICLPRRCWPPLFNTCFRGICISTICFNKHCGTFRTGSSTYPKCSAFKQHINATDIAKQFRQILQSILINRILNHFFGVLHNLQF